MHVFQKISVTMRACVTAAVLGAVLITVPAGGALAFTDVFDEKTKNSLGVVSVSLIKATSVDDLYPLSDSNREMLSLRALANGSASSATIAKKSSAAPANFYFRYDPSISPNVRGEVIGLMVEIGQNSGLLDGTKEKELKESLGQIDIMQTAGAALQAKGHPPHSLATAMAYWLVSQLGIAHGKKYSDQQHTAVLKQTELILGDREMASVEDMSDAEKQMAAERLLWEGMLLSSMWQQARQAGQVQQANNVAELARGLLLRKFNIDAGQMTISDQGLARK